MRNRLKNYGLWISILAFIPMLLQALGLDILPQNYKELSTSLLGIFVLAGIINNPDTENPGFADDKPKEDNQDDKNDA